MNNKKTIKNIQVLRAVAALLVVFTHLDKELGNTAFFSATAGWGGVDIFFVVSGFIMVYTTAGTKVSPVRFMAERVARIVPVYWLFTVAVFAIALTAPSLLQSTEARAGWLFKSLLFVPFAKTNGLVEPVLFPGWTLNYEMFFYVLFALGLMFPRRAAGVAFACFLLLALVLLGVVFEPEDVIPVFYTQPFMLEFGFGMLIALWFDHMPPAGGGIARFFLMAGLILAFAILVFAPKLAPEYPLLLVRGMPAAVIVANAVLLEKWGAAIGSTLLLMLGNASYSIYLTHPFVTRISDELSARFSATIALLGVAVATMAVACAVGVATHFYIERPLSDGARRLLHLRLKGELT